MAKKKIIILSGLLAVALLLGLVVFFIFEAERKRDHFARTEPNRTEQETLAEKQLKELEELRN